MLGEREHLGESHCASELGGTGTECGVPLNSAASQYLSFSTEAVLCRTGCGGWGKKGGNEEKLTRAKKRKKEKKMKRRILVQLSPCRTYFLCPHHQQIRTRRQITLCKKTALDIRTKVFPKTPRASTSSGS